MHFVRAHHRCYYASISGTFLINSAEEWVRDEEDDSDEGAAAMVSGSARSAVSWYIVIRAAEMFRNKLGRYPGDRSAAFDLRHDAERLSELSRSLAATLGIDKSYASDDVIYELVRFGSGEMQTTAAVLGGIAAQAALKILTRQFVPLDNTVIWNGSLAILSHLRL
jgi:amyloid beta precursor protein binding protein 1